MQSSPPTHSGGRPASPADTDYSVNLDALDMEDLTDPDVPQQKIDRIFSEDIDGPSDFTQNMEAWMRGGKTSKNTLKGTLKRRKPSLTHPIQEGQEEDDPQPTDDFLKMPDKDAEDGHTEKSHHTPENTPPKVSILDDAYHGDHFSSDWHTYDSASTPAPPVHKQFLQPTVEDHYSEFSPGRQPSAQTLRSRSLRSSGAVKARSNSKGGQAIPGRASSPTPSFTRLPIVQRTQMAEEEEGNDKDQQQALEAELRQLQAKCQQLEHLNGALGAALEEERHLRNREKTTCDLQMTEAKRREKDLTDTRDAAYRYNEEFRREFGELKEKMREQQRQAGNAQQLGRGESEQDARVEAQLGKEHLQVQGLQHHQEVKTLERDLELARRGRTSAEEALKEYREQTEEQRNAFEADVSRLRIELEQAHVDETAITELERRLEDANAQIGQLKAEKKDVESTLEDQRNQIARLKQSYEQESSRLTNERGRAVDLASGLQRQLQQLRRQLKDEHVAHDAELGRLRSEQENTSQVSTKELDIIREELEAKQSELNEAILERDEAQDTAEARQSSEDALKAELEDLKAVNAALDARVVEKLQKREQYWKEKLEESDKERQLMAKALLHQWGREEVGIDIPQLYAYKYMSKESPTKSPSKAMSKAAT